MTHALTVFACQFSYVLLLGLQTLNVTGGHVAQAMGVSLILGVLGMHLTGTIAKQYVTEGDWKVKAAYVLSGPSGIATSMYLHSSLEAWFK